MDNLTHSLVGATLAELALPVGAPRPARRTFFVAAVVAANLPDADLVYTRITPAPLGALLHHRGHTHTVAGLVLLGLAIVAVCLLPRIRGSVAPMRGRLWMVVAVALASHLVLDAWNSYGVHPFWPLSSRWFYGDAVFILEPWLWMLLGVAAVLDTRNRAGRVLLGVALGGLMIVGAYLRVVPLASLIALAAVALALGALLLKREPRIRAATALVLATAFVSGLFALREVARGEVLASLESRAGSRIVDVVLSSQAANPFCWSALALVLDEPGTSYVMTQGDAAVVVPSGCGRGRAARVVWQSPHTQSLIELRGRYRDDCWVRAWLQFGRAPQISDGAISDLRYGSSPRGNFTTMILKTPSDVARCPANLTAWRAPRADLLADDAGNARRTAE